MNPEQVVRCPLCLREDTCSLRYDKKGRPYLVCGGCSTRAFLGSITALTSTLFLSPHIARILSSVGSSVSELHAEAQRRATGGRIDLSESSGGG